jgi:hypothetical protein
MSAGERVVSFLGTLALFIYVVVVLGRGEQPNALAAASAAIFAAYLGLDFYVGLRYPEKRRAPRA